jgi:hypothetical protein
MKKTKNMKETRNEKEFGMEIIFLIRQSATEDR